MIWITDHVKIAKSGSDSVSGLSINKPVVLGEFGSSKGDRTRGPLFDAWLTEVDRAYAYGSGDGALVWQMICDICTNYASRLETVYPPPSAVSGVLCGHARTAGGAPAPSGSYPAAC